MAETAETRAAFQPDDRYMKRADYEADVLQADAGWETYDAWARRVDQRREQHQRPT